MRPAAKSATVPGAHPSCPLPGGILLYLPGRGTLGDMGSPDSTTPAEAEAVPYVTGQVVPAASSGSDWPETDGSAAEDGPQAPARVWPFLFEPRWLAWHLFTVLAVLGMLWLGDWQYHRAMGGNGLSWAYTFEWPLFAGFGIVFWARTIRDEFRVRRGIDLVVEFDPNLPEGVGIKQVEQPDYPAFDVDDPELASYNAYLAKLNTAYANGRKQITAG
jgi:hypothetical protein